MSDCWDNVNTCVTLVTRNGRLHSDLTLDPNCNQLTCGPAGLKVARYPEIWYEWPPREDNLLLNGTTAMPTPAAVPITNGMTVVSTPQYWTVPACSDRPLTGWIWWDMQSIQVEVPANTVVYYSFEISTHPNAAVIMQAGFIPGLGGVATLYGGASGQLHLIRFGGMIPLYIGPSGTPQGGGGVPGTQGAFRVRWISFGAAGANPGGARLNCAGQSVANNNTPRWTYLIQWVQAT